MSDPQTEIGGLDSGLFYSIIYFTVASIINILVCVLAARDTYKRVQQANKSSKKKWRRIPKEERRSTELQKLNEIMNAHSTTNLNSTSTNVNINIPQNGENPPTNYEKIHSIPLYHEEPSAEIGTKSDNENDEAEPPYAGQLSVDSKSMIPPKQISTSLEHPAKLSHSKRLKSKSLTIGVEKLPTTPTAGSTPGTPIEITRKDRMPRLNNCWAIYCFFSVGMGRRWNIYSPIILHVWDTATDFGVVYDWLIVAELQGFWTEDVTSLYYASLAILSMVLYRVISGISSWKTLGWKSGLLQFLDFLVYREVYEAYIDEKLRPTITFRWIRRVEATFESFPQSLIQIVWVLKTEGSASFLMSASILLSVYSMASSIIKDDDWKFGGRNSDHRKKCPPHPKFLWRALFRLCEVLGRLAAFGMIWLAFGGAQLIFYGCLQLVFYWLLFKEGKLGRDPGNSFSTIIAYPNLTYNDEDYIKLKYVPEDRNKDDDEEKKLLKKGVLLQIFGVITLWTPYAYLKKKWGNVTIFYASRFTENLLGLGVSAVMLMTLEGDYVNSFVYGSWIIGFLCNFYVLWAHTYKIRIYLKNLEHELNLDIWGVMTGGTDDIDNLQRYIKRAPQVILQKRDDGTTTLMFAAKDCDIHVLLCALHGDLYYDKRDLSDAVTRLQTYEYNQSQYDFAMKENSNGFIPPNGYTRDNEGRTCIYHLMEQHVSNCKEYNQLYKQNKDFKKRKEWLLVFIRHIIHHPPVELKDKVEYKRTGFVLGYVEENEYQRLESMMIEMETGGMTRAITDRIFRTSALQNDVKNVNGTKRTSRKPRSRTEEFIRMIPSKTETKTKPVKKMMKKSKSEKSLDIDNAQLLKGLDNLVKNNKNINNGKSITNGHDVVDNGAEEKVSKHKVISSEDSTGMVGELADNAAEMFDDIDFPDDEDEDDDNKEEEEKQYQHEEDLIMNISLDGLGGKLSDKGKEEENKKPEDKKEENKKSADNRTEEEDKKSQDKKEEKPVTTASKHGIQDSMEREMGMMSSFSRQITNRNQLTPLQNQKIFLNMADEDGRTALHWATSMNTMDFLNLFLELGADPNICENRRGETAMHMAVRKNRYDILDTFISWNNKVTDWMEEKKHTKDMLQDEDEDDDELKELENPEPVLCDWDIEDNMGANVVFACINHDCHELLYDLFIADINVKKLNKQNNTILQWAVKSRRDKCVKEILRRDMLDDVKLLINKNKQGWSALEIATLAGNAQIVQSLIEHFEERMIFDDYSDDDKDENDDDSKNEDDELLYNEIMTSLNKCIDLKNTSILRVFCQYGKGIILRDKIKFHEMLKRIIKINVKKDSETMFEVCCVYLGECTELLNENGENVLFYCIEHDKPKLLKTLVTKYNCSMDIVNKDGYDLVKYCDHFDRPVCKHFIQREMDEIP